MSATPSERVFLHDLSSPLMLAQGWLERLAKRQPGLAETDEYRNLRKQISALAELIRARREQIPRGADE